MAFAQTRTILDAARGFHDDASQFYHRLESSIAREKVKLLLNYLAWHEQHLASTIETIETSIGEGVLETWFKFPPDIPIPSLPDYLWDEPELQVRTVIEIALQLDALLRDYYRCCATRASTPAVAELFESLIALEQHEEAIAMRNALEGC